MIQRQGSNWWGGWGVQPPSSPVHSIVTPQPLSSCCVADPPSSFFTITGGTQMYPKGSGELKCIRGIQGTQMYSGDQYRLIKNLPSNLELSGLRTEPWFIPTLTLKAYNFWKYIYISMPDKNNSNTKYKKQLKGDWEILWELKVCSLDLWQVLGQDRCYFHSPSAAWGMPGEESRPVDGCCWFRESIW